jgi:hypothetical protein
VGDGGETTNLWDRLNDETDTQYIKDENGNNTTAEFDIGNLTDPVGNTLHVITFRMYGTGTGGPERCNVQLFEGVTMRADTGNQTSPDAWATKTYTLTTGEADAITDYTNLSLKVISSNLGGTEDMWVSWVKFEVPDAPAGGNPYYAYAQQ